jgi:uncharacterized protein
VIVADTGAVIALVDAADAHHAVLRSLYEEDPAAWILPWAILPEVDYLLGAHVGAKAQDAFLEDIADGRYLIDWGQPADLVRARALHGKYRKLRLGLVDGVVIAVAERLSAKAIATLDDRHFGAVKLARPMRLLPRDASGAR